MNRTLLVLFFGLLLSGGEVRAQFNMSPTALRSLPILELPRQDNAALLAQEEQARRPDRPRDFAVTLPVRISPDTDGKWSIVSGRATWRMRIHSPGAKSLNLGFSRYRLPEGVELYLATAETRYGPFTAADNEDHAQFWSPLLPGDELVIELVMPGEKRSGVDLSLSSVNHDFAGILTELSGKCNVDVACGARDGFPLIDKYRDVIRSVAAYTLNGKSQCTGFLVNNTSQDGRPLFITAEHCKVDEESAPSLVAYWNFQNSQCRVPDSEANGKPGDGKLHLFNTGARVRAHYSPTDMVLLELDEPVNPQADAFFAGWSKEASTPMDGVLTVHHPNVEEKRISFSYQETAISNISGDRLYPGGNFLRVPSWDVGTTQAGSSGAPLFDLDGLVRGQLFGGRASCGKSGDDMFGFLHRSWSGGGTPDSRLADWLDPRQSGTLSLGGLEQADLPFLVIAENGNLTHCVGDSAVFILRVGEGFGNSNRVQVSADPALRLSVPDLVPRGGTFRIVYRGAEAPATGGDYPIRVTVSGGGVTDEQTLQLRLFDAAPAPAVAQFPMDGAISIDPFVAFRWAAGAGASRYDLQLANDPSFTSLVADFTGISATTHLLRHPLKAATAHYWRVRAHNSCGVGDWSPISVFKTDDRSCAVQKSSDLPVNISSQDSVRVVSRLEVTSPLVLSSLEVTVGMEHTFIGDVYADLVAPDGTVVPLFRPLQNGLCSNRDLYVTFSDDAPVTADQFSKECDSGAPDNYRRVQPGTALSTLAGTPARGTWKLVVTDRAGMDGGQITKFELLICGEPTKERDLVVGVLSPPITRCSNEGGEARLQLYGDFNDPDLRVEAGDLALDNYTYSLNSQTGELSVNFTAWTLVGPGTFDLAFIVGEDDGTERRATTTLTVLPIAEPVSPAPLLVDSAMVTFRWRQSDVADGYTLQLAATEDFSEVLISRYTLSNLLMLERGALPGEFFWRLVASNSCGSFTGPSQFAVLDKPTSSGAFLADRIVAVYPNPTRDQLFVEVGEGWGRQDLRFTLFDAAGRQLREWKSQGGARRQLDLTSAAPGVYHLRIAAAQGSITKRILLLR